MANELDRRARLFSKYIGAELKGAITAQGYSQGKVADALGHARSSMSNWLNGNPPVDMAVAMKICEYIGVSLQTIVTRAHMRVEEEMGQYVTPSIDVLNAEERIAAAERTASQNDFTQAALRDRNKQAEKEYDADAGA